MDNNLTARDTALRLLERGLFPVPIKAPSAKEPAPKRPAWGDGWGQQALAADARAITATYNKNPGAGVGLMLGPDAGIIDIEIDGDDGDESLKRLFDGPPPPTLGWSSTRGAHRIFRYDPRLKAIETAKFELDEVPGVEFRIGGAGKEFQSCCPPTPGTDGTPRAWDDCDEIASLPAPVVDKILALFSARAAAKSKPSPPGGTPPVVLSLPGAGDWRRARYTAFLKSSVGEMALAAEGSRHTTLLRLAYTLGGHLHHGLLDEAEVTAALELAALRTGLPEDEADQTIRDGLASGREKPLELLPGATAGNASDQPESQAWGALRIAEMPTACPFPTRAFPPQIAELCGQVARSCQVPNDYVGLPILAVASGAIGLSYSLRLTDDWEATASLYCVAVGDPGSGKTPAMELIKAPLHEINQRIYRESKDSLRAWFDAQPAAKASPRGRPRLATDQPTLRRLVLGDSTREGLCELLRDNPRGLFVDRDEALAWVRSFGEYKQGAGTDRQFWLSTWSNQAQTIDRKGAIESVVLARPFVTFLGGIQPAVLPQLGGGGGDDGFVDRVLFAYPPRRLTPRRWSGECVSEELRQDWSRLVHELHSHPLLEKFGRPHPRALSLTPEAQARWVDWYNRHNAEPEALDGSYLSGAWSKFNIHAARLILIVARMRHALQHPAAQQHFVQLEDVESGILLAEYFKIQRVRVEQTTRKGVGSQEAGQILEWIERHRPVDFREADVSEHIRRFRDDKTQLRAALRELVDLNAIRPVTEETRTGKPGRKPTPLFEVHPELHRRAAAPTSSGVDPGGTAERSAASAGESEAATGPTAIRDEEINPVVREALATLWPESKPRPRKPGARPAAERAAKPGSSNRGAPGEPTAAPIVGKSVKTAGPARRGSRGANGAV